MVKLSLINKQTKTHRSYEADTFEELYLILRDRIKLDSLGEELEGYINKTYNFNNIEEFENYSCYELGEDDFKELIFESFTLNDYYYEFKESD